MAKGLDDLLRYLVKQIAFQGETGASTIDVADYITSFYGSNGPASPDNDSLHTDLDRSFLEQVWSWLVVHPELHVRPQKGLQELSLEQVELHNSAIPQDSHPRGHGQQPYSSSDDKVSEIRLYASDEQMWLALTGHGPDYKRVPALEFTCLSVIGAHRAKGIVQPLLVQITGQDKRSVPERTNQLAEKGYIVKRKVLSQRAATSLCILKQFSTDELPSSSDIQTYEGSWVRHRFAKHESLIREALEVLDKKDLITWVDLRALLGIPEGSLVGKRILEAVRLFENLGCLERVRTVIPSGLTPHSHSAGYRAIQSLRPVTAEDWDKFYSAKKETPGWRNLLELTDANKSIYSGEDPASDVFEDENAGEEAESVPLWNPDRNIANICYSAVQRQGYEGAITSDACDLATGAFCRRSTSGLLQSISNTWHADRPLELAILRDAAQIGRKTVFKYYTFESFKEVVDRGESSWEAVGRPLPSDLQITQSGLFREIAPSSILNPHATLAECLKPALSNTSRRQLLGPSNRVVTGRSDNHKMLASTRASSGQVSRGTGTRKYAVQYSEAELKAMPLERRKKILNSIEMGRRYHRRKLQELIEIRVESGQKLGSVLHEMEQELEALNTTILDSAAYVKLDIVREMSFTHRNSLYLPSKAAHSIPYRSPCHLAETPSNSKKSNLRGRKGFKPDSSGVTYLPSVAAHSQTSAKYALTGIRTRRQYNKRQKVQKHSLERKSAGGEISFSPLESVQRPSPATAPPASSSANTGRRMAVSTESNAPSSNKLNSNEIIAPVAGSPSVSISRVGRHRRHTTKALDQVDIQESHAEPVYHSYSALTYEQQYSTLQGTSNVIGLNFGPIVRLKTHTRGPGPKSLLVVFRLSRLKGPQFSLATEKSGPYSQDATELDSSERNKTNKPPAIPFGGTGDIMANNQFANSTSPLLKLASGGETGNLDYVTDTGFQPHDRNTLDQLSNTIGVSIGDVHFEPSQMSPAIISLPETLESSRRDSNGLPQNDFDPILHTGPAAHYNTANSLSSRIEDKGDSRYQAPTASVSVPPTTPNKATVTAASLTYRSPSQPTKVLSPVQDTNMSLISAAESLKKGLTQQMTGISRYEGSTAAAKKKIILEIVAKCDGVFPGEREIWYPFTSEWIRRHEKSKPDTRTVVSLVKQLVDAGKLRRLGFNFETARAGIKIKHVLCLPNVSNDDGRVQEMKQKIIDYYPRLYIPESSGADKDLTRNPESWWTPGQPRHGWGDKMIEGSASNLPMPPQISKDIQNTGGKTATERLRAWQDNIVFKQRQQNLADLDEDEDTLNGETSNRQGSIQQPVDVQAFIAARRKAMLLQQRVQKASEELGEPSFVVPDYSSKQVPSSSQSKHFPQRHLQTSFQGTKDSSSTDGLTPLKPTEKAALDRQKRINRLASLKMLGSGTLSNHYKASQVSAPQPQEVERATRPALPKSQVRLPRLPRQGTHGSATSHPLQDKRYKFVHVSVGDLHRPSVDSLLDDQQAYFTATGTFGTFLQRPSWFVPESLDDILHRKWPGKPDNQIQTGSSSIDQFRQLINSVQAWELNDCVASIASGKESPFINFSTSVASKKPRKTLVPRARALERNLDKAEGNNKRGPAKDLQNSARKRRRRSVRVDDRTPESEKDVLLAIIVSKSLFQSGDERFTNWSVVKLLQGDRYEEPELKRLWNRLRPTWKAWYDRKKEHFESEFLKAYSSGEIPLIRYDDTRTNDWGVVMNWARGLLEPRQQNIEVSYELPSTREEFAKQHATVPVRSNCEHDTYEVKQKGIRLAKRRELLHLDSFAISEKKSNLQAEDIDDATISRSWVRANALTLTQNYHCEQASRKLSSVDELDIESAVQQLLTSKLLVSRKKGRDMPGRSFDVSDKFFSSLKTGIEVKIYKKAANYKVELDKIFEAEGSCLFSFHAEEGCALAVINLLANGSITAASVDVKDDPMGHLDEGYRARTADKELFRFDVRLEPTERYAYGNPLLPLPPLPQGMYRQGRSGIDKTPIPAWKDIHGNNIQLVWENSLCCLLAAMIARPGLPVKIIEEYFKPALGDWEVYLMMDWAVKAGIAEWQDTRQSSLTLREWWWLALDVP